MTNKEVFLEFTITRLDSKVTHEFEAMREYIKETDYLITKEQQKIEAAMEKDLEKFKKDPRSIDAIHSHYSQEMFRYFDFSNILLNSTFIASCALFESLFREICITTYQRSNGLTVDDISGRSNVETYKKFLTKVIHIDMDRLKKTLESMKPYHELRNKTVHEFSNYWSKRHKPLNQQSLHQFISGNKAFIENDDEGNFKITDKKFILNYCDHAEHYVTEVIELIREKAASWPHIFRDKVDL